MIHLIHRGIEWKDRDLTRRREGSLEKDPPLGHKRDRVHFSTNPSFGIRVVFADDTRIVDVH